MHSTLRSLVTLRAGVLLQIHYVIYYCVNKGKGCALVYSIQNAISPATLGGDHGPYS